MFEEAHYCSSALRGVWCSTGQRGSSNYYGCKHAVPHTPYAAPSVCVSLHLTRDCHLRGQFSGYLQQTIDTIYVGTSNNIVIDIDEGTRIVGAVGPTLGRAFRASDIDGAWEGGLRHTTLSAIVSDFTPGSTAAAVEAPQPLSTLCMRNTWNVLVSEERCGAFLR